MHLQNRQLYLLPPDNWPQVAAPASLTEQHPETPGEDEYRFIPCYLFPILFLPVTGEGRSLRDIMKRPVNEKLSLSGRLIKGSAQLSQGGATFNGDPGSFCLDNNCC